MSPLYKEQVKIGMAVNTQLKFTIVSRTLIIAKLFCINVKHDIKLFSHFILFSTVSQRQRCLYNRSGVNLTLLQSTICTYAPLSQGSMLPSRIHASPVGDIGKVAL